VVSVGDKAALKAENCMIEVWLGNGIRHQLLTND